MKKSLLALIFGLVGLVGCSNVKPVAIGRKMSNPFISQEQSEQAEQIDIISYAFNNNFTNLVVSNNPSNSLQSNFVYNTIYENGSIYIQGSKTDNVNTTSNYTLTNIKIEINYELETYYNYLLIVDMSTATGSSNTEEYLQIGTYTSSSNTYHITNSSIDLGNTTNNRNYQKGCYLITPTYNDDNFFLNFNYDVLRYIRWNGTLSERFKICDIRFIQLSPSQYYDFYKSNPTESYSQGYTQGQQIGYDNGYEDGEVEGYGNGYDVGVEQGKAQGQQDVIQEQYSGYTYQQIFNIGYNQGYHASVDSGSLIPQLFSGIIDIPIEALNGLMPLTFFDVSIIRVVISLLAFSVVLYIIGYLMNKGS